MITIVCGPPCAGKSTYVSQHAQADDLVVDHDQLAIEAGSPVSHGHRGTYRDRAEADVARLLGELQDGRHPRAWVIRSLPRLADRRSLAERIHADHVVVLNPGRDVLVRRAQQRRNVRHTVSLIDYWLRHADDAGTVAVQPAASRTW